MAARANVRLRDYIRKKDSKLGTRLDALWDRASSIHDRQTRPGKSCGGSDHCERVEENAWWLIRESERTSDFQLLELFLLSCAACLSLLATLPLSAWSQTNIKTKINPIDGAEMVYIPEGKFTMGSNDYDNEKPPHKVYLDGYWIYRYEVTVAQYRKFCHVTNRKMKKWQRMGWKENHPIVGVGWIDAHAYCKWAGVQLPTEAQWEKAARGGLEGKQFPWGDRWPPPGKAGNFRTMKGYHDGFEETAPVGSFAPNGYGLYDMAGNASEWCADWYGGNYYKNSPHRNPTGPRSGKEGVSVLDEHVIRGGAFEDGPYYLRVATRLADTPPEGDGGSGFRCVAPR